MYIVALSEHVIYWDHLGWKDPFSSPRFTERQKRYAPRFPLDDVFTPQLMVDGHMQMVGNDAGEFRKAFLEASRTPEPKLPVAASLAHDAAHPTHEDTDMTTIHHQVPIRAGASRVYQAISTAEGISTWWDKQTPIQTNRGLVLEHNPGPQHGPVQLRIVELIPNQRADFECISHHPPSSPASVWTGTHFIFELSTSGDVTTLDFRQTGYDEQSQFFGANNLAWERLLQHLKEVIESQNN